ncbi:hypothetical protein SKAU_G00413820 [Synaphobranchus kaupii]|uniref:Uncharacterized protein n=1 Tax=Synaphobranchus kaupii TaxID=118154 RepID=A0A9Q1IBB9_SYNKA|nr:hypothetical protein SKAU_G00413820 [Synaphobranchus kaupii]
MECQRVAAVTLAEQDRSRQSAERLGWRRAQGKLAKCVPRPGRRKDVNSAGARRAELAARESAVSVHCQPECRVPFRLANTQPN